MKKIALFTSLLALFFITCILPLHHHTDSNANTQTHCTYCQLANASQTVITQQITSLPTTYLQYGTLSLSFELSKVRPFLINVSPRAPPLS